MGAYENALREEGTREEVMVALERAWQTIEDMEQASSLTSMHEDVARFNLDLIGWEPPTRPTMLSKERHDFRMGHMQEELSEVRTAHDTYDMDGYVDGIIDLVYVALGALVEMGVCTRATFQEVHAANMRKTRGTRSKRPGSGGYDAVKPPGWEPPDLTPYLSLTRRQVLDLDDILKMIEFPDPDRLHVTPPEVRSRIEQAFTDKGLPGPEIDRLRRKRGQITGAVMDEFADDPVPPRHPRILIMGHARHGKDTVAEMLAARYDLNFTSSSWFCAERVILPKVHEMWRRHVSASPVPVQVPEVPNYKDVSECFEDRSNHRAFWHETIRDYNRPDATRLAREIFQDHNMYVGIRSRAEFNAVRNVGGYEHAIWVDASDRLPPEDKSSISVEPWMADYVVDNNGNLEELKLHVDQLMTRIL